MPDALRGNLLIDGVSFGKISHSFLKKGIIMPNGRGKDGRFLRKFTIWTPECYDNGFIDVRGRFRVYRPDCPRTFHAYGKSTGIALRAHVVWWLFYGEMPPDGWDIHHKNHNRLDDSIENLEAVEHRRHGIEHNPSGLTAVELQCKYCGRMFAQPAWRIRQREREGYGGIKYCSRGCSYKAPVSIESRERKSVALKKAYAEGRHKKINRWARKTDSI